MKSSMINSWGSDSFNTYPEIACLMKNVKMQDVKNIKQEQSEKIKNKKD